MKKLQSTKHSIKENTTISALQDAKNPLKPALKSTLVAIRQVPIAVAVTTTAKPLSLAVKVLLSFPNYSASICKSFDPEPLLLVC